MSHETNTCGPNVLCFTENEKLLLAQSFPARGASWLTITAWQKSFIVVKAVLANHNRELKRRDASNVIPFSSNINKRKHHLAQYQVVYDEYRKISASLETSHDAK